MIAHIYPSVLQALSGRGYAGCVGGCFQGYRGEAMQDLGSELPRIPIPRTWVNKPPDGVPEPGGWHHSGCRTVGEERRSAKKNVGRQGGGGKLP